jgi:hypothetical protein
MAKVKPTVGAFIRSAVFIDNQLTTRKTKFTEVALLQVANQINELSIPLLRGHDSSLLPSGRWFEANVNEGRTYAKFFVPKEVPEHDEIKSKIESFVLDSVSIGFSANKHTCSTCGNDIEDYENCPHIPGREYDGKECFVYLEDIKVSEGSLVYAGAVPEAKILDYSEVSDKKDFCGKFQFSTDLKEIVKTGEIMHEEYIDSKEDTNMDYKEKFMSLEANYADLAVRNADNTSKYALLQDEVNNLKTEKLELTASLDKYKIEADGVAVKSASLDATIVAFKEVVEKLAAPFEATYKAPESIEALTTDLTKYVDLAKTLPVGQQSGNSDDITVLQFEPSDNVYKI